MVKDSEYQVVKYNPKKNLILVTVVFLVILTVVLVIFFKGYTSARERTRQEIADLKAEIERLSEPTATYMEATKEVSISVINADIQEVGELATIEYLYTDAGKFTDAKKLFDKIDIVFTEKSFIAKWDGCIKAGVNIKEVKAELDEWNKKIIVYMPEAEILSHEIDMDSIETLDEKDGLFNPIEIDDVREFDAISKDAMEQRAIENGILDKAFENAEKIIFQLVNTELVEELGYTIVFELTQ